MKTIVTFGELMLRLSPPPGEMVLQTPAFRACFGGAEANVAVSLARFGAKVAFVSALPDNPVADAALRELGGFGVDTAWVERTGDRIGIYYAEGGAAMRPSKVVYDRDHSSFSGVAGGDFDWECILADAEWLHVTGITPAIAGGTADATREAFAAARGMGVKVSCDLNFRRKLWKWGKTAREVMPDLVRHVDVLIANEEDCQQCLGIETDVEVSAGKLDVAKYEALSSKVLNRFPNLSAVAVSLRESVSADWNNWSVVMHTRDRFYVSRKYEIRDIVDRIGGGDSFGAGLIWGFTRLGSPQATVDFAAAASALKHSILGDYNRVGVADVERLVAGDGSGRVQR